MLFLGDDWAEAHHDIELQDDQGRLLARRRVPEGVAGLAQLHGLIAEHLGDDEPASVLVGIETDRGGWVQALVAAGYVVFAINPRQVCRYRERHSTSGAKSDAGDAHVLAEIVRHDSAHHRPVTGDSEHAEAVKTLARTHQTMIWTRQRQTNQLRSMLREFYPAALEVLGDDLPGSDALAVLGVAATPAAGRALRPARVAGLLRKAGRRRNLQTKAEQITTGLRTAQLELPAAITDGYGASVKSFVAVLTAMVDQIALLEGEVERCFGRHPDAEIITSQPGLGVVLGARVLGEFGDDPDRFVDAKARRNYAGTSPITKVSGTRRVVLRPPRSEEATRRRPAPASSPHSPPHPAHAPSTTTTAPEAPPTTKHYGLWPTASSASSTAACGTTPLRRSHRLGTPPTRRRLTS